MSKKDRITTGSEDPNSSHCYKDLDSIHEALLERHAAENSSTTFEGRSSVSFDTIGRFYVDPRIIPPGFSYSYRTESVMGKPTIHRLQMSYKKGWRPVPAHRHPELRSPFFSGNADESSERLREGGAILMEREEYISEAEKKHHKGLVEDLQERARLNTESGFNGTGVIGYQNDSRRERLF